MGNARDFWEKMANEDAESSVIDPYDKRGNKIDYICQLRNRLMLAELQDLQPGSLILDFGCGNGDLSRKLYQNSYSPVGIDITYPLLRYAGQQSSGPRKRFIQFDGLRIPSASRVFDAVITHLVLNYVADDTHLQSVLAEMHRVLKPSGKLIAIEQVRRSDTFQKEKRQRTVTDFSELFHAASFTEEKIKIVRRGHFPLIYLIRYGFIPRSLYQQVSAFESWLGRRFPEPRFDYADCLFVYRKK